MYQVLLFIYVVVAIALIGFILVQQGKGANAGASFGGGASGTMFGSAGAGNFLTRTSAILATAFFVIALVLGNMNSHKGNIQKVLLTIYHKLQSKFSNNKQLQRKKIKIATSHNKNRISIKISALVVELVDTLS